MNECVCVCVCVCKQVGIGNLIAALRIYIVIITKPPTLAYSVGKSVAMRLSIRPASVVGYIHP